MASLAILVPLLPLLALVAGVGLGVLGLLSRGSSRAPPGRAPPALALQVGVVANVVTIVVTTPILAVPAGESIRPMAWAAFLMVFGAATLASGLPLAVADFLRGRRRAAVLGFAVCLLPCPLAFGFLFLAVRILDLHLSK